MITAAIQATTNVVDGKAKECEKNVKMCVHTYIYIHMYLGIFNNKQQKSVRNS